MNLTLNMRNMMSTGVLDQLNVLTPQQVEFYNENGYLHIPADVHVGGDG